MIASQSGETDGLEDFVYVARGEQFFELTDQLSLMFGMSAAFGQSRYIADDRTTLFGGDLYLKWNISDGSSIATTVEWIVRDTQISGDFIRDSGGYLQVEWHLNRQWLISARGDYGDIISGKTDQLSAALDQEQMRGSVAISWLPTHFSKIRLQYDLDYTDHQVGHIFLMQLETTVGAHGAHLF